jgi:hypothetical protein
MENPRLNLENASWKRLNPDYAIGIGLDGKVLERSLERVIFICSKNHPYG